MRNSFFGLIKFYAQKDIRPRELDAMLSFLANTRNPMFQADLLDMLIALLEAPANAANDQLFLLMFEPHMADGLYSLVVQPDISERVQRKLLKVIKILHKTNKVYDKIMTRMRLNECGTYAGLVGKLNAEYEVRRGAQSAASARLRRRLLGRDKIMIDFFFLNCDCAGYLLSNQGALRLLAKSLAWQDQQVD